MQRLIAFFRKIAVPFLFIVAELLVINHYAESTPFNSSRILVAAGSATAGINRGVAGVKGYFGLRRVNDSLLTRVAELENNLEAMRKTLSDAELGMMEGARGDYYYTWARVVENGVGAKDNFIVIDKGLRDSVHKNMALVTPEGTIAGYVLEATDKYSFGISILNRNFRTGGKIRGKDYFGSVWWDGFDNRYVTLSEIPKYADLARGDTVETGYSSIFPSDIMIGTIEDWAENTPNYYDVRVRLRSRMSKIRHLMAIDYFEVQNRLLLEEMINEEQTE